MAKKKTSFVLRVRRGSEKDEYLRESLVQLLFLNNKEIRTFSYFCYKEWLKRTNVAIEPGKSQKVRFTVEKVED
jgi:hypothetical protein